MKRTLLSLLALLLVLCTLLASCKDVPPPSSNDDPDSGDPNPPAGDQPYTTTENYVPAEVFAQMKTYFEEADSAFTLFSGRNNAPFVTTDVFAISNCKVKSITIPVFSTGKADSNGDFIFSLYVLPNDWATLKAVLAEPGEPIEIKINAAEHGLEESKAVRKFITVDLSAYDIELSENETLGFTAPTDTIYPAQVLTKGTSDTGDKHIAAKYLIDNWNVVGYYYYDTVAQSDEEEPGFTYIDNSLFFDFVLERTWESESAYNEMLAAQQAEDAAYAAKLAAVKAAYSGKTLSLIGDSISTFNTVTNDKSLGLGDNPTYSKYTLGGAVYSYTKTYWGKLVEQTQMELGIINSWGAGMVYGRYKYEGDDGMLLRSYNLARNGEDPDVVILNYGINDMGSSFSSAQEGTRDNRYTGDKPTGNLYQRLTAKGKTKTDKEIVGEWFAEVQNYATQGGWNPDDPATITHTVVGTSSPYNVSNIYVTWEAAYALSVWNILRLYEGTEIYCVTLPDRNHTSSTQPRLSKANLLIKAIAEYFEVGFVDQLESGVVRENCIMYSSDGTGLHPNGRGHAALTKAIVEAMYERLPK